VEQNAAKMRASKSNISLTGGRGIQPEIGFPAVQWYGMVGNGWGSVWF